MPRELTAAHLTRFTRGGYLPALSAGTSKIGFRPISGHRGRAGDGHYHDRRMALSIDVVIPAHNHFELTEACLRGLAEQTVSHRVIVYDDASTDATAERIAAGWPHVSVVGGAVNVGYASACNAGGRAGEGEVVVLLNNDVECRADFLERLCGPLEREPRVGSVAALMLQPGERLIDSIGLTCDRTLAAFPRMQGRARGCAGEQRPVLAGPAGTAAAYRRSAWEQVGGLDETITAYMEDFDLALRLRSAGWEAIAAPDAVGVHLGSATYGRRTPEQRLHGGFARGYVLRRYGVLHTSAAPRALLTEAIAVAGDALLSRDLAALRGRVAGFRAGGAGAKLAPPQAAIDHELGFRQSLALRRGVYATMGRMG
jgi:N-acetylglucosaminyl-diphospho-decaprenol L-rhamnosyltransferase